MNEILFEGELVEHTGISGGEDLKLYYKWAVRVSDKIISLHEQTKLPPLDLIYLDDITWIAYKDEVEAAIQIDMLRDSDDWARAQIEQVSNTKIGPSMFVIGTSLYGYQKGRKYIFKTPTVLQRQLWVLSIRNLTRDSATLPLVVRSFLSRWKHRVTLLYLHPRKGYIMSIITLVNFVETVGHQQLLSGSTISDELSQSLKNLESAIAFAFLLEVVAYFYTGMTRSIGRWIDGLLSLASMGLTFVPKDSPAEIYFQVWSSQMDHRSRISMRIRSVLNSNCVFCMLFASGRGFDLSS
jgi:hypothetical protein